MGTPIGPDAGYPREARTTPTCRSGLNARGLSSSANAGVSVGTNGISVFEHGPSYLPSLLVYDAPTPITEWTHIAVVYENRTPRLYVNGVLVRTGLTSGREVSPSKMFGNAYGYGQYVGRLDDIGIYSRALTDAQVQSLASGIVGKCPR